MAETKRSPIRQSITQETEPEIVNRTIEPEDSGAQENSIDESHVESDRPTHDEIAVRAYRRWRERGGAHGADEEDWYQAEQELRAERKGTRQGVRSVAASA